MATADDRLQRIEELAARLARLDEEQPPPALVGAADVYRIGVAKALGDELVDEVQQLREALRRPAKSGR